MAVLENSLLEQLDRAITETPDYSLSKLYDVREECRGLKDRIQKKMPDIGAPVDPKIKENLYYLNNVMVEWRLLLEKHHVRTPETIRLVSNLRRRINQIRNDLQEAPHKEKVDSERGGMQSDLGFYRWSSRLADLEKIYGINDKAMIMERLLVKEGFKGIGIVGMAGVGKTTICQYAFNDQRVKKHFLPRVWACLSEQPGIDDHEKELVKMILICLGFQQRIVDRVGQGDLNKLLFALRLQLKRQRYLVVLDDVWNSEEDFKKFCTLLTQDDENEGRLGNGLPKTHGGAVIVTSRSPIMVENVVGEKNLHSLLPLADKESCWKIFKDAAEKDGIALTEDMTELKDEIAKKCAGLPLIAKKLGQIEHGKPKNQQSQTQQETHQEGS